MAGRGSVFALTGLIAAGLPALSALEDPFRARALGMGVEFGVESLIGGDFRFGSRRYDWDEGLRYVVAVRSRVDLEDRLEPYGGLDLWWDDRSAVVDGGTLESNALGFHLVSALGIHLLPQPDRRRFTMAVTPHLHGGFALQNISIRTVSDGTLDISDETDHARLELGVGISLRVAWAQRWAIEAGVGARLWSGGTVTVGGTDGVDPATQSAEVAMSGDETFWRLAIGFWW